MKTENKLIVILGPTACGKTKIATRLAARFNGEIISADSRQVYKGMDIGTGKDLDDYVVKSQETRNKKQTNSNDQNSKFKTIRIRHHLIDVVKPMTEFNVARYQKLAYKAIDDVIKKGKIPMLVGGTGLYIDAVVKGYLFSSKHQNIKTLNQIRKKLDKLSLKQLLARLKKIDPKTYKIIDKKNRRRVQRALEIYYETGLPKSYRPKNQKPPYAILTIGIKFPQDMIYQKIDKRLGDRIDEGMVREVKKLRKSGVAWKRLDGFGLEYRWVSRYLRGQIDQLEMIEKLKSDIHHFAKRQLTWFKRDKSIKWVEGIGEADKLIKTFLN